MIHWFRAACGLAVLSWPGGAARADSTAVDAAGEAFFEAKVRPLLLARCSECHGEAGKAKGGLRLHSREALLIGGETGPSALPGQPEESAIVRAVRYVDDPKMPPKGKLPDDEIATLERWVAMGLPWPKSVEGVAPVPKLAEFRIGDEQRAFWSFRPVRAVEPPRVRRLDWPLNPVDRFLLSRLENEGLEPAPPADRATLIRRATFDLTGLPPAPEEVARFVEDDASDAFEKVVDRLLASPSYGQRWGRHWLDVARYADSRDARGVGGGDDIGEAWRYRDWVVEALNRDLPYDQFVANQVAGDLLPGPTPGDINPEGMVATGLLTIGEWGTGDSDKEKMLTDIVADQVDVVTRGFLGLTVACARCHDHKFDPISAADYYGLAGIFFSTKILPDPGPKTAGSPMLRTSLATKAQTRAIEAHAKALLEAKATLASSRNAAGEAVARAWLPRLADVLQAASGSRDPAELPAFAVRKWGLALKGDDGRRLARAMPAVQGFPGVDFWGGAADPPWIGVNATGSPVTFSTLTLPPRSLNLHPGPRSSAAIRWRSPIEGSVKVEGMVADADPNCGDGVTHSIAIRRGRSSHQVATDRVDNGGKKAFAVEPVEVHVGDVVELMVSPRGEYACDSTTFEFRLTQLGGESPSTWDATADLLPNFLRGNPHADRSGHPDVWELVELDRSRPTRPLADHPAWAGWDVDGSVEAFARQVEADPKLGEALVGPLGPFRPDPSEESAAFPEATRLDLARKQVEVDRLQASPPPSASVGIVAVEGGVPRSVYEGFHDAAIQLRGDYRRLGPVVPRHFPSVIAGDRPPTIPQGSGRLELSRWIASSENPLTARVMVNRLWQGHFGSGLVRTSSNFGKLGEAPSHPELLDWLADRLVRHGWSLKSMHRLMMTSRAYRQASSVSPESRRIDPENRLWGRMDRRRLEAEAVRDNLLAVSGQLDTTLGGPSTRDFNASRRTLYLMTIRSDRSSFGPLFDAADSTAMVDRRVVSTVAPQALFLMNHPFVLDRAKALGARLLREGADEDSRIARAYSLLYARRPTPEEMAIGRELLGSMTRSEGSSDRAWTAYAQVLLCSNEFLYVD